MVADSSANKSNSNGGAEKKKERTAGQFFHIGEQGEQADASPGGWSRAAPPGVLGIGHGSCSTMTPRKELLDDVQPAQINKVCSASRYSLKVAGAGRAEFKGEDSKQVVLHDVLLVPHIKANLISLRKPLDLVHLDLVGSLPAQGHKKGQYFLTIVDVCGRLMWAYPRKEKDHAAFTIQEDWLSFMENQVESVVKRIKDRPRCKTGKSDYSRDS
ncbi:unnamed protein product [Closterium sp. NIES-54]